MEAESSLFESCENFSCFGIFRPDSEQNIRHSDFNPIEARSHITIFSSLLVDGFLREPNFELCKPAWKCVSTLKTMYHLILPKKGIFIR